MHSIWLLWLMLVSTSTAQPIDEFLKEYRSSWQAYVKKCIGLQCYRQSINTRDSEIYFRFQFLSLYGNDEVLFASHAYTPKTITKGGGGGWLLRRKNGQVEQFKLLSQIQNNVESAVYSSNYLRIKEHQWILMEEKIINTSNKDFLEYSMHDFHGGGTLVDGFKVGLITPYIFDFLAGDMIKIDKFARSQDSAEIHFSFPDKKGDRFPKQGVIKLEKLSHWLVKSVEAVYQDDAPFADMSGWFYHSGKIQTEYQKFGDLFVPSARNSEITIKEKEGKEHSAKEVTKYSVSRIEDVGLLQLSTYGIPERTVKPDLPAPIASVDSSAIEGIPLWGWLTVFAVVLLVAGLLLRRGSKAKST